MRYQELESEYDKIFKERVLPFINKNIKRDFFSAPVYYLLDNLNTNRFRGSLPIMVAREYNKNEEMILPLSAFCELTFTTAMAQDDYYDDDKYREGFKASHEVFGIKETLLSCDYINHKIISVLNYFLGRNNISESKCNRVMNIVNNGINLWYSSVILEINSKKDLFSIDEEYIRTIYLNKTIHGRIPLECAFLMIQDDEDLIKIIKTYSEYLAIAGQLKNDIYDFTKNKDYRGLSDLRQGHITWPLYLLVKSLNDKEKENFLKNLNNKKYEKLIILFKEKKIIEKTLELIDFHVLKSKELIKGKFPKEIEKILEIWAEGNRNFSKEPKI